jgi:magnesium and cobalt transporter
MPKEPDTAEPPEKKSIKPVIKNFFSRFLKKNTTHKNHFHKMSANSEQDQAEQNLIIKNFESFAEKTAEDVMIPRSDIISVKCDISLDELTKTIIKQAHTRTLVYKENLDNIIGFVHIKDLFEIIAKSKKFNLKKLIRKNLVSPPFDEAC